MDNFVFEEVIIANSSVFCEESSSCSSATILDSKVECSSWQSCADAIIERSSVHCTSFHGCYDARFTACAISCGMVDQPCDYAKCRDQCSCCDGDVCPSKGGLQKCTLNGAPSEDFCSSESAGITCETLGNPICSGTPDDVTTTTSDPASTTSKPQGTNPSSPIGTTEPGGSNSASSPQYTESTPNSQTTSTATSKDDPPLPLSTSTATSKDDPPIAAIVAPVVVAVIGLAVAVVQRKKIVHVYNHYRVGDGISANPAKP